MRVLRCDVEVVPRSWRDGLGQVVGICLSSWGAAALAGGE